jgi:hypothetical protein
MNLKWKVKNDILTVKEIGKYASIQHHQQ